MKVFLVFTLVFLNLSLMSCDRPAPVEDLDREEEMPVEDTFEPVPTEIP